MESRRVIAVFDSAGAAQHARDSLLNLGLGQEQVDIIDQSSAQFEGEGDGDTHRGIWAQLKEFFVPGDRAALDESIRRGGYIVSAAVADDQAEQAIQMLEREGAVDLQQRQAEWRSAGWRGSADEERATTASAAGQTQTEDSESIPVVEEQLRVGKREVNKGTVRVHSRTVEEPVHENVRLRQEHVRVERERVEEPTTPVAAGSPRDLLREKTVEVTETAEEPVVGKEAVVKEHVRVTKTADERLEQVDDTVRHTEVDVEDDRAGAIPPAGTIPPKEKGRTPRQR